MHEHPFDTPVEELLNIGPKTAQRLHEIGLFTKGDLIKTGPIITYKILKHRFKGINILALYALYGAVHELHWNGIPKTEKEKLKKEADVPFDINFQ